MTEDAENNLFDSKVFLLFTVISICISSILLSFLLIDLTPKYNVTISSGGSMAPTFDNGCQVTIAKTYTGQELHEGQIIAYETPMKSDTSHRIVKKYDSYNHETDNHTEIEGAGFIEFSDTAKKYEGDSVYIMKGDGNESIDPYIVTKEDVTYTLTDFRVDIPAAFAELLIENKCYN